MKKSQTQPNAEKIKHRKRKEETAGNPLMIGSSSVAIQVEEEGNHQHQYTLHLLIQTFLYRSSGSPTFSISGIVHFRSNALDRTILKIFCTLIL